MPSSFVLWGSGWRAQYYLRVAAALPGQLRCCGVVESDPARIARLRAEHDLPIYATLDEVPEAPAFTVLSLPAERMPGAIAELARRRRFALAETWPADSTAQLEALYREVAGYDALPRIQVAEQYTRQPLHAARLALLAEGVLGRVYQAQLSCAHGYHGASLLRHYLGVGLEGCEVTAREFADEILRGPGRKGYAAAPETGPDLQRLALLRFAGGAWGVYDFTDEQYFSPVRRMRLLVRGAQGEMSWDAARWFVGHGEPVEVPFCRQTIGPDASVDATHATCVTAGERTLYRWPWGEARLNDDEAALADLLVEMAAYAAGDGPPPYPFEQGLYDQTLDLLMREAAATGEVRTTGKLPWIGRA